MYIGLNLQLLNPDDGNEVEMVRILNQISNQLRNTSDPAPNSVGDLRTILFRRLSIVSLTASLVLVLLDGALALLLKHWQRGYARNLKTFHNPEEQARNRELYARGLKRWAIPSFFELLASLMQLAFYFFYIGAICMVVRLSMEAALVLYLAFGVSFLFLFLIYLLPVRDPYTPFVYSHGAGRAVLTALLGVFRNQNDDSEIAVVGISNCLFIHTSMIPKNLPIFIQLFSLPVKCPLLSVRSLWPWNQLSLLLPSMLREIYSQSRFNLLPALRLCLVISGQGQPAHLWVNKEAKRAYSTIKASNPLQNLYLHLLLSRVHATTDATDYWQGACRIIKCMEHSEEHTLELVCLVNSIQLYALEIEEDFTTRIVEFLQGVVVYLAKCPSDESNGDLLRTATIMAAEWLISRQSPKNGNLRQRYILSGQAVQSGEANSETFVLVNNHRLSQAERLQRSIELYQESQKQASGSSFVIRTLLIAIMAIEGFAAEKDGESISDAIPRIQRDDLRFSLEGLWDLWEGGFNQSDLLRFVSELVVPPSSTVGGAGSSMVILLLKEYLQQINGSPAEITEKAFRFIDAALEHSLTTGTTKAELELQLQGVQSPDPWLALSVDNILRRRATRCVVDLERINTLDSRIRTIISRKRLNLYLSSNIEPEPDILTLLVQSDDVAISLEAFSQGLSLLESPLIDESNDRNPGSRLFTFVLLGQEQRSRLISRFFNPQQSTAMYQTVWVMFTEDLYPRWELLPTEWRRGIAKALVGATEWMEKGQKMLAKEIKKRRGIRASTKAEQLIGMKVLALRKRKQLLETRDERFPVRLEACGQVYLRLFATAVEELGESAKSSTLQIVDFLVQVPDELYDEDAIKRIQHVLGI